MDGYHDDLRDGFAGRLEVIEEPTEQRDRSLEERARIAAESPVVGVNPDVPSFGSKRIRSRGNAEMAAYTPPDGANRLA